MKVLKNIGWFIGMYLANIIIEIDIFLNVVLFFGATGETISSHMGRVFPNSLFAKFIDKLFFFQRVHSHCQNAAKSFHGNSDDDLIPKANKTERIMQILIVSAILFIIIVLIFG